MGPAEPPALERMTQTLTSQHITDLKDATGQTMTEYAFILAFIVLVVIVVIPLFGTATAHLYNDVVTGLGG
jgi:Flp pilus assembly pilin Flp